VTTLLVVVAGSCGALARYALDDAVALRAPSRLPLGTLVVNISGSFVLGVLVGLNRGDRLSASALLVTGTGFCGGFTTFSTFAFETVRLFDAERADAGRYVALTTLLCLPAAGLGLVLAALAGVR
jgi:fluoride exporter